MSPARRIRSMLVLAAASALAAAGWLGLRPHDRLTTPSGISHRSGPRFTKVSEREPQERERVSESADSVWEMQLESDPAAMATNAVEMGSDAVVRVAVAWAARDPEAATAWTSQLEGECRDLTLAAVATELAPSHPDDALAQAQAIGAEGPRDEMTAFVMAQMAEKDPEAVLKRVSSMVRGPSRNLVEQRVLPAVASKDPWLAANYAADHIEDAEVSTCVIPEIVSRWTQVDPGPALAWTESIPNPVLRARALESLFRVWVISDPACARQWWDSQAPSCFRDQASVALSASLVTDPGGAARKIAATISDPEMRRSAIEHLKLAVAR